MPETIQNILAHLAPHVILTAYDAGQAIMRIYNGDDFEIQLKADNSPLTAADKAAHNLIMERLQQLYDFPVLSEESKEIPYETRSTWTTYWLVDPLDGTKEFIKKNGEFTVNIALIQWSTNLRRRFRASHWPLLRWCQRIWRIPFQTGRRFREPRGIGRKAP